MRRGTKNTEGEFTVFMESSEINKFITIYGESAALWLDFNRKRILQGMNNDRATGENFIQALRYETSMTWK